MESNQIIAQFKTNLIKIRRQRGFSQRTLAKKMGVSQRVISYYEKDASDVPLSKIVEFADSLEVSISELLDTKIEKKSTVDDIDVRVIRKIRQIEQLPRRTKEALLHTISNTIAMQELKQRTSQKQ